MKSVEGKTEKFKGFLAVPTVAHHDYNRIKMVKGLKFRKSSKYEKQLKKSELNSLKLKKLELTMRK